MAGKAKRKRGNELVLLCHRLTGWWVSRIVHGVVDKPYTNFTPSGDKAARYKRWEAERFLKWIGSDASTLEIIPVSPAVDTVQQENPNAQG